MLDSEDEPMTHGSPYNFAMLNSSETSHIGKTLISPNWRNHFYSNLWCWNEDRRGYLSPKFQTHRSSNFGDTVEIISGIYVEEFGKLGIPVSGASLHCFQKSSTLDSSR